MGTQLPLRLLLGGRYVRLPSMLNVNGCGADRGMHGHEQRTAYGQDLYERQLRAEFGRMGGLIHFTVSLLPVTAGRCLCSSSKRLCHLDHVLSDHFPPPVYRVLLRL